MRRAIAVVLAGFGLLAGLLAFRAARLRSRQPHVKAETVAVDATGAAARLAGALRCRTVSHEDPALVDAGELLRLHDQLRESFPRVHAELQREVVAERSLLFTWSGSEPSLAPILLLGHLDTVPVEQGTAPSWEHPPFGGDVAGGFVWGRGALDDKAGVVGVLEAVETLLAQGARPRRSVVLAFGHDEEVQGHRGAKRIVSLLRSRGLRFAFALDEGSALTEGMVPGLTRPAAFVGIAEKGYVSLELKVETTGGHSSMPPRETAIGILSAALHRLETRPMPARLVGPTHETFEFLAPEMPWSRRTVLANLWLFGGLAERLLARSPETNALLRTTTATTMVEAGVKENVLPTRAGAAVNFRIRPGDSVAAVVAHARRAVADPRLAIAPRGQGSEPSPVSRTSSPGFDAIARSVREVFPDAVVAPSLVLGATDSRHYASLAEDTYRFVPIALRSADLARVHGVNERVAVEGYANAVRFYVRLLRNAAF